MTAARRPADVTVHEWQHRLIDERVAAWRSLPARSGLDRIRRREAAKRAYWTVRGHLQSHHARRWAPLTDLIDDLLAVHDELHTRDLPCAFDDGDCICRPLGYEGYDFCRQGCDPECPVCSDPDS